MENRRVLYVVSTLLLLAACAEQKSPSDSGLDAHPSDWAEPTSSNFHGDRVAESGPASCAGCHGSDFEGTDDATGCGECHDGVGGHPYSWVSPSSDSFHGLDVEARGIDPCQQCHGQQYRGDGWSEVSCYTCHAMGPSGHPDGWLNQASFSFHGRKVTLEGPDDCRRCHGQDLAGGSSGLACAVCH